MTTHRDPPVTVTSGLAPLPGARQAFVLLRTVFTVARVVFGLLVAAPALARLAGASGDRVPGAHGS